jgi:transcription elongation factor Elf1
MPTAAAIDAFALISMTPRQQWRALRDAGVIGYGAGVCPVCGGEFERYCNLDIQLEDFTCRSCGYLVQRCQFGITQRIAVFTGTGTTYRYKNFGISYRSNRPVEAEEKVEVEES